MGQCNECGCGNNRPVISTEEQALETLAMMNDILSTFIGQLLDFAENNWTPENVKMLDRSIDAVLRGHDTFTDAECEEDDDETD